MNNYKGVAEINKTENPDTWADSVCVHLKQSDLGVCRAAPLHIPRSLSPAASGSWQWLWVSSEPHWDAQQLHLEQLLLERTQEFRESFCSCVWQLGDLTWSTVSCLGLPRAKLKYPHIKVAPTEATSPRDKASSAWGGAETAELA